MQVIEGLVDMPSQQFFQRMLKQQPKNRYKSWKQSKSNTKFLMKARPILTERERLLLESKIATLPNSTEISLALLSHTEQSNLYFLN